MSNDYFRFKRFTIRQERCAMKVGTDGTLLGAWAQGGNRILDVGTGTGLIALMMAQRFPKAQVTGVDIDGQACGQARENVEASPFDIEVVQANVCDVEGTFDCIVSNPPYFEHSLECPDDGRTRARHTSALSYRALMASSWRLLADDGELSLVIPAEGKARLEEEAALAGFSKSRECWIRTTPRKAPKRCLLAFRKHPVEVIEREEGVIETAPKMRSDWYQQLTKDFYL